MSSFRARFKGTCDDCGAPINPGDRAAFNGLNEVVHAECPDPLPAAKAGEVACPACFLIHPVGACDA